MPKRKKGNPEEFTTDEVRTAQNLVDEGWASCQRVGKYTYPLIGVDMCDREALEPTSRVFGTSIAPQRRKKKKCPTHLFPPDGKGDWTVRAVAGKARATLQRLDPLLTQEFKRRTKKRHEKCP